MSNFDTAMNILELSAEGTITEIKPKLGDKRKLLKVMQKSQWGESIPHKREEEIHNQLYTFRVT